MKTLKLGVMRREEFQRYTLAIAKGEIRPEADAPKVWFDSVGSLAQILSTDEGAHLLQIHATQQACYNYAPVLRFKSVVPNTDESRGAKWRAPRFLFLGGKMIQVLR